MRRKSVDRLRVTTFSFSHSLVWGQQFYGRSEVDPFVAAPPAVVSFRVSFYFFLWCLLYFFFGQLVSFFFFFHSSSSSTSPPFPVPHRVPSLFSLIFFCYFAFSLSGTCHLERALFFRARWMDGWTVPPEVEREMLSMCFSILSFRIAVVFLLFFLVFFFFIFFKIFFLLRAVPIDWKFLRNCFLSQVSYPFSAFCFLLYDVLYHFITAFLQVSTDQWPDWNGYYCCVFFFNITAVFFRVP